ncbi:MAG: hypothetical protein A2X13_15130 [Bacteroidetes bacterium GWC2_33_15]|nr:MAG: hypothetical protein A2X10_07195 [Bacteroidetes bacterium GWA2_33_15]OFX50202.1 MAG: hypothetical protein A2X13_15130 [Bacteroidetes bacterium GWC2_33_15]OFX65354.1 MAG: hypothetical protein A2X15_04705 [Bacteroidetes bacterium GWB2_32_14]OFX70581.1 MAG: hypothetical protein A2X14_04760 [Bacteroidetes bacterium GWD2_33_33]HAN19544.1 hypothetical protein [Bacteroidales bacterium]
MNIFSVLYKYRIIIGIIIFAFLAFLFRRNSKTDQIGPDKIQHFQQIINEKIKKADATILDVLHLLDSLRPDELMNQRDIVSPDLFEKEGIILLGYKNDSLFFWTDNLIPVDNFSIDTNMYSGTIQLSNGWYVVRYKEFNECSIFALILIKNEYSYENNIIKNEFRDEYNLLAHIKISNNPEEGIKIYNSEGDYVLSLIYKEKKIYNLTKAYLSASSWFFLLLLIFVFIKKKINAINSITTRNYSILGLFILLALCRYLMLIYNFPQVFKQLELFQPHHFAISFIVPSLGDLLINAIFLFYFFIIFYTEFNFFLCKFRNSGQLFISVGLFVLSFFYFLILHYFFQSLILHSSISFDVYQLFDLSIYTLIGFVIIALLLTSLFLFIDRIAYLIKESIQFKRLLIVLIPVLFVFSAIIYFLIYKIDFVSVLFYIIILIFICYIRLKNRSYSYPVMILLLLFFAIFTVLVITASSKKKDQETRKVLVVNLANEHDQIAEMLLESTAKKIEKDSVVIDLLSNYIQNEGAILEHLQMNYFGGYFIKYKLQISVCDSIDNLTLDLGNSTEIVHCYSFFNNYIVTQGTKLQNSNFYFLDNVNGIITYLGQFKFRKQEWNNEVSLFVSLDSKLITQELGYPELLLDKRLAVSTILSDYSYAKYRNNELITRSGEFTYQRTMPESWFSNEEFYFTNDNLYDHLIYKIDDETQIVISNNSIRVIDIVASLSYIFVFYYLLFTLVLFVIQFPGNIQSFKYDFKNKIKFSMIGVLLLSLLIVGFGTVYYNIDQFEKKLYESISEKTQSVFVEMKQKLGGEIDLNPDYSDYLTYLLDKFSTVFYIDINLYDIEGNLLASSRPQVFEKGLMGKKMNVEAYREMVIDNNGKFIHKEKIGDLSYLSAYVPFVNDDNELLAYLNLPYFTKQSALKKETYTIVVAVVNIYFFLILLSVVIAIFVSNNITKPLQLIQERFREIDLGKKNEPIVYESLDEIGSLIKEYNRMVDELSENAKKLAKSERESAWREMAKQIAHEIKNPLTPMKLSVQYLQRAWKDNTPDFDSILKKFTNSLIGQINTLSSIATEFSNFASMPRTNAEQVDIISKLNETLNLFQNHENIKFLIDYNPEQELFVFADKEQLLIVFRNLFQNAIQAIPQGKDGIIRINLTRETEFVRFTIIDNGSGIAPEMQEKLFRPNFTTKSSGMGLGLAIVKNIIQNSGGEIWYETEILKGTSFHFTLPVFKPSNN